MEEMTAAYITAPGPAESIRVGPLPVPAPGATEVLVRLIATEVNHVDTYIRAGRYRTPLPTPFVIGRDLVGEVAVVGSGTPGVHVGDLVWSNSLGHAGRQGSFSEYVAVAADRVYPVPDGVAAETVASVAHTAATAHLALFREARLRVADTVLVGGADGGVGSAAVQLAHAAGARVVATASARDAEWVRSCGADVVLDYRDPMLAERLREAAPDGVDVHFDTSGREDLGRAVGLLAQKGRILITAAPAGRATLPTRELYQKDANVLGFVISNASIADLADAAGAINALLAERRLRGRIGTRLRLPDAARAHRMLEDPPPGAPPGRIIVTP